jgi:outer membrane protein insertion porin family
MPKISKLLLTVYIIFNSFFIANAEIVKKIEINGNKRISDETIKMFSTIKIDQNLEIYELNDLIRRLYSTNYFKNIK